MAARASARSAPAAGREGAGEHDALGVRRAESGVHSAVDRIESIQDFATRRAVELITVIGGHRSKFSQRAHESQNLHIKNR